jgi:hypothetical protein
MVEFNLLEREDVRKELENSKMSDELTHRIYNAMQN